MLRAHLLWKLRRRLNKSSSKDQASQPQSKVGKIRALSTSPLSYSEKYLSAKMFFRAPKAAVADVIRLSTSASEVSEY